MAKVGMPWKDPRLVVGIPSSMPVHQHIGTTPLGRWHRELNHLLPPVAPGRVWVSLVCQGTWVGQCRSPGTSQLRASTCAWGQQHLGPCQAARLLPACCQPAASAVWRSSLVDLRSPSCQAWSIWVGGSPLGGMDGRWWMPDSAASKLLCEGAAAAARAG